jgi:hypothetical protein
MRDQLGPTADTAQTNQDFCKGQDIEIFNTTSVVHDFSPIQNPSTRRFTSADINLKPKKIIMPDLKHYAG